MTYNVFGGTLNPTLVSTTTLCYGKPQASFSHPVASVTKQYKLIPVHAGS